VAEGFCRQFRLISALIALAAAIALFRFKRGVIQVIAACAVLGLLIKTLL
jgi:chromate transporter